MTQIITRGSTLFRRINVALWLTAIVVAVELAASAYLGIGTVSALWSVPDGTQFRPIGLGIFLVTGSFLALLFAVGCGFMVFATARSGKQRWCLALLCAFSGFFPIASWWFALGWICAKHHLNLADPD